MPKNTKVEIGKVEKNETKVEVSLPSCIQIELVQGNELRHYEIFFLVATITLSTGVSFWTSYATTPNSALLFSALAFSGFTLISGRIAFYYRSKLYNVKIKKVASLDIFKTE
jgi:hypothetical protein